mmetsp:Transcript_34053/g.98076  ORF Transcript_34053/g.98076 Transcript_34053/m.98076 type:complete len:429 (+) Transcript_34053:202-1488(+)
MNLLDAFRLFVSTRTRRPLRFGLALVLTVIQPLIERVIRALFRGDAVEDKGDPTSHLRCRPTIGSRDAATAADSQTLVSVCSYNVLAPSYVKEAHQPFAYVDFPWCAAKAMSPQRRFGRVLAEVKSLGADVVGFQEVQREVLDRHLQSTLKEMGYGDLFFESKTLGYGHQCKEGLLTAVRSDRFTVEHKATVDLDERVKKVARRLAGTRVSEDDIEALGLPGGNVGQVLMLRCRRSGRLLLFANVHIHYYWLRPDRQCLQISAMVGAIAECATQWGVDLKETPLCFVGDFNTVPQIGSRANPGYSILSRGCIDWKHDSTRLLGSTPLFQLLTNHAGMSCEEVADMMKPSQGMGLTSVYANLMGREPTFTNHTGPLFADCLDYIWVSGGLRPISCLGMPPRWAVWRYVGAPNLEFPSDHFSLRAELAFV